MDFFFSIFLLSTTTKCFRLILYIFFPSPRTSHYRKFWLRDNLIISILSKYWRWLRKRVRGTLSVPFSCWYPEFSIILIMHTDFILSPHTSALSFIIFSEERIKKNKISLSVLQSQTFIGMDLEMHCATLQNTCPFCNPPPLCIQSSSLSSVPESPRILFFFSSERFCSQTKSENIPLNTNKNLFITALLRAYNLLICSMNL